MSKHSNAEAKLHISPNLSARKKLPAQKLKNIDLPQKPWPPKGTNASNKFM